MKIAIASDHRGILSKERVSLLLKEQGHEVVDVGTNGKKSCDYTDFAYIAARKVSQEETDLGILICGSGIGMSICANKIPGVRAALCQDELSAELSRRHNNANVLCLASDVQGEELMRRIVLSWLKTDFEGNGGGRHYRRVKKIEMIEQSQDPSTYEEPV